MKTPFGSPEMRHPPALPEVCGLTIYESEFIGMADDKCVTVLWEIRLAPALLEDALGG